jgi:hypothetical protein
VTRVDRPKLWGIKEPAVSAHGGDDTQGGGTLAPTGGQGGIVHGTAAGTAVMGPEDDQDHAEGGAVAHPGGHEQHEEHGQEAVV